MGCRFESGLFVGDRELADVDELNGDGICFVGAALREGLGVIGIDQQVKVVEHAAQGVGPESQQAGDGIGTPVTNELWRDAAGASWVYDASEWKQLLPAVVDARPAGVSAGYQIIRRDAGWRREVYDGSAWQPVGLDLVHNLSASAAPTSGDDDADGYSPGSLWVDATNDQSYICVNASTGAAVWNLVTTPFLTKNSFGSFEVPTAGDDNADGYSSGSLWVDNFYDEAYICVSNTTGGASWKRITNPVAPLNNLSASAAPTTGDDDVDGYSPGSLWVDTTNDGAYLCLDASSGVAVWTSVTAGGSSPLSNFGVAGLPTASDDAGDGYSPGSLWWDSTNDRVFVCVDASIGASVWKLVSNPLVPGNNLSATSAPTSSDHLGSGYSAGSLWVDTYNQEAYVCLNDSFVSASWTSVTASASGEANTASNVGTSGVGLFKQKSSANLEFKKLNGAASGLVTVTDDTANDEVDLDLAVASQAEAEAGTATDRAMTPLRTRDAIDYDVRPLIIAASNETSNLAVGTAVTTFRMPFLAVVVGVRASVTTAPTGSGITVDINESGLTILSTKLTIDAGEKTSTTAATAAVLSDTILADDAEITIDIDAVGSTTPGTGLKVTLLLRKA